MPKFNVWVQRTTVEHGIVVIEADSLPDMEETVLKAHAVMDTGAVDWETGEPSATHDTVSCFVQPTEWAGENKTARLPQVALFHG
jgi:hypothetical protein